METFLVVLCFWLLLGAGSSGLEVTKVVVPEGSDAVLNCSFTSETHLRLQTFDWKRHDKEVFFYDQGKHYNNGLSGQDPQFKGRVSHFNDQLEYGNASILIKNTQVNDSGTYSCVFPHLKEEKVYIQLVVHAVSKVHTEILDATNAGVLLRCEVQGAFPKPNVTWEDDGGNPVTASEPQISSRGGRYDVFITAHVTKTATNNFCCVVRQEEILHEFKEKLYVPGKMFQVCEDNSSSNVTGMSTGVWIGILIGVLIVLVTIVTHAVIKKDISWFPRAKILVMLLLLPVKQIMEMKKYQMVILHSVVILNCRSSMGCRSLIFLQRKSMKQSYKLTTS
ncbi:V-set domain-containing T-cell activation inhibitor 1-like isoform X2 [Salarias fasciatus]|uniref:V-set domain-containing T-cell activation inhibitor 1-like isoform X2 n=1 Tax=Salarias fasciatus TaxID=181472 RepID=UPI0011766488|nr:V-set domain-containing T-cell activation inhibitor 1-like isoform X2 [Salarias fasciatus]